MALYSLNSFNQQYYLANNPDVAAAVAAGTFSSALQQYELYGEREGRMPNPGFNPTFYSANNPDVVSAVQSGSVPGYLWHFENYGLSEGRAPAATDAFDEVWYLNENPDVAAAVLAGTFVSGWQHYALYGAAEGREPSPPVETFNLSVDSPSVHEAAEGTSQLVFTLTLDQAPSDPITVNYQTLNTGTATAGQDFNPAAGVVTFAAGQTSATVSVTVLSDNVAEANETVKIQFTGTALSASVTATGTIIDTPPMLILTPQQDILTGGAQDDTFYSTNLTLQTGDRLTGGGGTDTLLVAASGDLLAAPTLREIEVIRVNAPNVPDPYIGIDLSNSDGYNRLESYQVTDLYSGEYPSEGGYVGFFDIQNVNGTDIAIVDTNVDHEYTYDTNAYLTHGDNDTVLGSIVLDDIVDLTLQEVKGSTITFGNDVPYTPGDSNVDQINLVSLSRTGQPSDTTANYVEALNVGDDFDTLRISGSADLEVCEDLDRNIRVINAAALAADLTLSVDNTEASDADTLNLFQYVGAQADDDLTLRRNGNATIQLDPTSDPLVGNDYLDFLGNGNLTIDAGDGNDTVSVVAPTGDSIDDGRHLIDLGAGNDDLTIVGDVDNYNTAAAFDDITTITAGAGNDDVEIDGNGRYSISLGAGDDSLFKSGSGNNTISAGDGNDYVEIRSGTATNNTVDLEAGDDTLLIVSNGNQAITAGTGNDKVTIDGNGVHRVDLGAGDDYLLIDGARNVPGNIDNTPPEAMTTVIGGEGNDTVDVRLDHYLNADLGAGNDLLILRAEDLTTDDLIVGGAGTDTLRLTNFAAEPVRVGESETNATTGIEVFDLRDSNITLVLTPDNFDTAEQKSITVNTQESDRTVLPPPLVEMGLHQGMTAKEFYALAQELYPSVTAEEAAELLTTQLLVGYQYVDEDGGTVTSAPVKFVNFSDVAPFAKPDADWQVYSSDDIDSRLGTVDLPGELQRDTQTGARFNDSDQVFFTLEPPGAQTVDITAVPLSTASGRTFTLLGGNIRDIVVADDDSINGRATLTYDGPASANQSIEDTLRVEGNATITAADLRNVTGLELIQLATSASPTDTVAPTWEIELNDKVINQTTGSAPLVITVDPNVPAGSQLYITLDPSVRDGTANDVVINVNSNVDVFIKNLQLGPNAQFEPVTSDDFGTTDYDLGNYSITVHNQLLFTTNTDSLVGGEGDDTFIATSLSQIQSGDFADGNGGFDTAEFSFPVAGANIPLVWQFNGATFEDIERFEFNTNRSVAMAGVGYFWAPDLQELATGDASDTLSAMRKGLLYQLNGGNDSIGLGDDSAWWYGNQSYTTTVEGGRGLDTLQTEPTFYYWDVSNDTVAVDSVEFVNDDTGYDTVDNYSDYDVVTLLSNASDAPEDLITIQNFEAIYGSEQSDHVYADSDGGTIYIDGDLGNDTLTVGTDSPYSVTAYGGLGDDKLTIDATSYVYAYGDDGYYYDGVNAAQEDTVIYGGDDTISVTVDGTDSDSYAYVYGEGGGDKIDVSVFSDDYTGYAYVAGDHDFKESRSLFDDGNDTIDVYVQGEAYVNGNGGDDHITVDAAGDDSYGGYATVYGDDGNDVIDVSASYEGNIYGGAGNDSITVHDAYDVGATSPGEYTIAGGAGNDTVDLTDNLSGYSVLEFGDIFYDALQHKTDEQGLDTIKKFNFEVTNPGDPAPDAEDGMDFTAFLGTTVDNQVSFGHWNTTATVDANAAAGNSIVALSVSASTLQLTQSNFSVDQAGTIQINDNGSAVVVVGLGDHGNGSGIQNFNVWYVEDVNTGAGQTWAVNQVATVSVPQEIGVGIGSVMDNLLVGITGVAPVTGAELV